MLKNVTTETYLQTIFKALRHMYLRQAWYHVLVINMELRDTFDEGSILKVRLLHPKNTEEQLISKTRSSTVVNLNSKYIASIPHCYTICWFTVQINEPIVTNPYKVNEAQVRKLELITNSFPSTSCCRT